MLSESPEVETRSQDDLAFAAELGQQLLQENKLLKEQLSSASAAHTPSINVKTIKALNSPLIAPSAVIEIQTQLLKHSRALQHELSMERETNNSLNHQIKELESRVESVLLDRRKLKAKLDEQKESSWSLSTKNNELLVNLSESRADVDRLQRDCIKYQKEIHELKKAELKNKTLMEEECREKNQRIVFLGKLLEDKGLDSHTEIASLEKEKEESWMIEKQEMQRKIESLSRLNDAPTFYPSETFKTISHEDSCIHIKLLDSLVAEKLELEQLLNATQEECERLNDESMMFVNVQVPTLDFGAQTESIIDEIDTEQNNVLESENENALDTKVLEADKKPAGSKNDFDESLDISSILDNDESARISIDSKALSHFNYSPATPRPWPIAYNNQNNQNETLEKALETSTISSALESSLSAFSIHPGTTHSVTGPYMNPIECLTYTMLGSWFTKYNRHSKQPRMKFFSLNPYSRTLSYTTHPGASKSKSVVIEAMSWTTIKGGNFLPGPEHAIIFQTKDRTLKVVPISWHDYDIWIRGVSSLLAGEYGGLKSTVESILEGRERSRTLTTTVRDRSKSTVDFNEDSPRRGRQDTFESPKRVDTPKEKRMVGPNNTPLIRRLFLKDKGTASRETLNRLVIRMPSFDT